MAFLMVIEDDTAFCFSLQAALTAGGHRVIAVRGGAEGLRKFRAEPSDLVLTDMVMPGTEAVATILTLHREYPQLGIIAMSGASTFASQWLQLARRLGACRTLVKPFALERLIAVVSEVLEEHPNPLGQPGEHVGYVPDQNFAPVGPIAVPGAPGIPPTQNTDPLAKNAFNPSEVRWL